VGEDEAFGWQLYGDYVSPVQYKSWTKLVRVDNDLFKCTDNYINSVAI